MPTFVGGTHNSAASAATITATYSPTALNYVVVFVAVGGSVSGLSVQDNNGNYLIQGPCYSSTQIPVPGGTGYLFAFFGMAQTGVTSYTANWTTNRVSSIVLGEYSAIEAIYFILPLTNWYATGTSGTAAISETTVDPNDIVVAGFMNNSTDAFSAIAGTNQRENSGTGQTAVCCLVDSGVVSTVNLSTTVQATIAASVAWAGFAMILRPFAGGGYTTTNTTGAISLPQTMNVPAVGGTELVKPALAPGTGAAGNSGVIYGNVYRPGQTFP